MGDIHVNRSLDLDRQIFHYMSFYELVELLKFNQAFFTRADRPQRQGILQAVGKWSSAAAHNPSAKTAKRPVNAQSDEQTEDLLQSLPVGAITLQSWTIPADDTLADWAEYDSPQPRVCIVSNIRALSQSLFVDDATSVFIDLARYSGIGHNAASPMSLQRRRTKTALDIRPDNLCAIAFSNCSRAHASWSPAGMHFLVDLRTLLLGVVVPPTAPMRFLDLVSKLVQDSVWVSVSRARRSQAIPFEPRFRLMNKSQA